MRAAASLSFLSLVSFASAAAVSAELKLFNDKTSKLKLLRGVFEGSIRTSWEQGTASQAVLEWDYPEYTVFGRSPFKSTGKLPTSVLHYAISAVVRQSADGRLSQMINDGKDGASLDGASAAPSVVLGMITQPSRKEYWTTAAEKQLNLILNNVPRTSTGAISHRMDTKQYWADGVYMGFPFLAYYGVVTGNQSLVQEAYDQCRLYRDGLLIKDGPYGPAWGHLFSDDNQQWYDRGLWLTGNAWAAKGIIQVAATIEASQYAEDMSAQLTDLKDWIQEIFDGVFPALKSDGLLPDYIQPGGADFSDAAASAALASVAYRAASLWPKQFDGNYLETAGKIRDAVLDGIDELGLMTPLVDPLKWDAIGVVSTEGQAFGLMLMAAWRDYLGIKL
ncbi:Six-hairpin glycosidase [Auricularia subglabra TFB-10046 SS5]|nr:Six-hairpin glycosidase [Auricularia subglabra TFB-10046 SS5]